MTAQMSVPAFALEYSDVPRDHWAYSEIQRSGEIGFMSGMGDGTFGLGQNVTPVSYTHLDVYKRQQRCSTLTFISGL